MKEENIKDEDVKKGIEKVLKGQDEFIIATKKGCFQRGKGSTILKLLASIVAGVADNVPEDVIDAAVELGKTVSNMKDTCKKDVEDLKDVKEVLKDIKDIIKEINENEK